jgi:hypothetical protein
MTAKLVSLPTPLVVLALVATSASGWAGESKGDDKRGRLPAAVVKAIDENVPGAEIHKLEIGDEEGIKVYDVEFKAGRGEIDVAEDGTVLDVATIVEMNDIPEAAAAVIRKAATGTTIKQLEKSEVRARIEKVGGKGKLSRLAAPEYEYEAELKKGGEIEVAADGRIIKAPKSMRKAGPGEK